jgi:hypothetical protein
MKFWTALTIVAMFLATPLICIAMPCDFTTQTNDCCPKSRGLVACPYDVLETAKASATLAVAAQPVAEIAPQPFLTASDFAPIEAENHPADHRDLHTRIRVLLI